MTQFRPIDDRRNYRRGYLLDRMAVRLGGRASEEVTCGEITSGAQNDLQDLTGLAWAMMMHLDTTDELGPCSFKRTTDDALAGRVPPYGRRKSTAMRRRNGRYRRGARPRGIQGDPRDGGESAA
jgi:ATP-dependent Zn protease